MFVSIPMIGWILRRIKSQTLDSVVDRLHYLTTTSILLFFGLVIGSKQHFGSPIQCMVPQEFRSGWEQYTEDFCFIQGTFVHSLDPSVQIMSQDNSHTTQMRINYYQWVPLFLIIQAFFFHMPAYLWAFVQQFFGSDMEIIVSKATEMRPNMDKEELTKLAILVEDSICHHRRSRPFCSFSLQYLLVKTIYFGNAVFQFLLANHFLNTDSQFWGFQKCPNLAILQMIADIFHGRESLGTHLFPRVTFCDVVKLEMGGNSQRHTVQCVLMINMLNEKIFLFLWFWMLFVSLVSFVSLVYDLLTLFTPGFRLIEIRKHLSLSHSGIRWDQPDHRLVIRRFANLLFQADGILLFRFIFRNAGANVVHQLACTLLNRFIDRAFNNSFIIDYRCTVRFFRHSYASTGRMPILHDDCSKSSLLDDQDGTQSKSDNIYGSLTRRNTNDERGKPANLSSLV